MKEPLKQEIRRILLGYIDYDPEERLIAAERTERLRLLGLFNGTGAAGVFGVAVRRRRFSLTGGSADIEGDCRAAFANMGRSVALDAAPELTAVFYSPILFNPSVLTAASSGDVLEISVYTARTLTVGLNAAHAFRRWRQNMPGGLREKAEEGKTGGRKRGKRQNAGPERNRTQKTETSQSEDGGEPEESA